MCGGERFCLRIIKREKIYIFLVAVHHFQHFEMLATIIVIAHCEWPLLCSSASQQHLSFMSMFCILCSQ